jgi:membrane-bound lytic murein transglycosylase D
MTATLVHTSGSRRGHKDSLDKGLIRLGRKPENQLVFTEGEVSSYHAEIRRQGNSYTLIDLESTNGTWVNGSRIEKVRLEDRDKIELGEHGPVFEFRADASATESCPSILPRSGSWEHGRNRIELRPGATTFGRDLKNDIVVGRGHGSVVSSEHAVIRVKADSCALEDLGSTNGTFVNGERIRAISLHHGDRVQLGEDGPEFEFQWEGEQHGRRAGGSRDSEKMFRKLVRAEKGGQAGEQTMMLLQAAHRYYRRRRWPLLVACILGLIGCALAGVFGYRKVREIRQLTQLNNFYEMRRSQIALVAQHDSLSQAERQSLRDKRLKLLSEYEGFLQQIDWYARLSPAEQAVMRLARQLGETSLEVPPGFISKALDKAQQIKSQPTLAKTLERARSRKLIQRICTRLDQYDLPHEFFFIALWESGFDAHAVGPPTSFGIAKGMWQLLPSTAQEYGPLKIGPWKDEAKIDPSDERHDEDLSTMAAVRYLSYLYATKAAASGLLVMASYNYGQTRIIARLDSVTNDPRQRNFWNFYRNGWIPEETREYVMSIFASALLCENPALFGLNMQPIDKEW